jgi:hypothetical protein
MIIGRFRLLISKRVAYRRLREKVREAQTAF